MPISISTPTHKPARRQTPASRRWLLCLGALALTGCALLAPSTPEQQVQQRAQARWQALSRTDFNTAYGLLAPSLRALLPAERWTRRFGRAATWNSADVTQVTCEAARCTATIRLTSTVPFTGPRAQPLTTHLDETWVLEDGQWWFFQKL